MPSTIHILETALLILAAFLIGSVVGYLARRLIAGKPAESTTQAEVAESAPAGPQLVVAPTIAPVARGPSPAQRLASAAAGSRPKDEASEGQDVEQAPALEMKPAHVAGHATSGKEVPPPVGPQPVAAAKEPPGPGSESATPPVEAVEASAHTPDPAGDTATVIEAAKGGAVPAPELPETAATPMVDETTESKAAAEPTEEGTSPVGDTAVAQHANREVSATESEPDAEAQEPFGAASKPAALSEAEPTADADVPAVPAVEPERPTEPVRAENIPDIDEAAHVVEGRAPPEPAPGDAAVPDVPIPPPTADNGDTPPIEIAASAGALEAADAEDAEAAAMRAIEGGWTPRASVAPKQPAPPPDLAPGEIEAAMQSARSAVASAAAAAKAAVSGRATAPDSDGTVNGLDFELDADPAEAEPVLAMDHAPQPDGLDFEPERPVGGFGKPETLMAPRAGGGDNLKQIRGVTPDLEHALNRLGIFHYDQIAGWDQKAVVWLDHHLSLRGRIGREKWIDQAKALTDVHPHPARPIRG